MRRKKVWGGKGGGGIYINHYSEKKIFFFNALQARGRGGREGILIAKKKKFPGRSNYLGLGNFIYLKCGFCISFSY